MFTSGAVHCVDLPPDAAIWLDAFFTRYPDQLPDLADAALMLLADRDGVDRIFTLDRRDFRIYRTLDGNALDILPSA
jgi:predicted nucleic acid-binding protein